MSDLDSHSAIGKWFRGRATGARVHVIARHRSPYITGLIFVELRRAGAPDASTVFVESRTFFAAYERDIANVVQISAARRRHRSRRRHGDGGRAA
jgi:hypothetical protein